MEASRRAVLTAAALASLPTTGASAPPPAPDPVWLQSVLERYAGFGIKASGGAGDEACGAWLEGELRALGYACERQLFQAPFFEVRQAALTSGDARAEVFPQAPVTPTTGAGITAPLRLDRDGVDLSGAIALVVLPFKRWTSLSDPQVSGSLGGALNRGAVAVVLVTTGPTREAVKLNVRPDRPSSGKPVALLAPKDAAPFVAAAREGRPAMLVIDGAGGRRPAWNLIARVRRGRSKGALILSTPRSGWFTCAAERGSGLAVWLWLARQLPRTAPDINLELLCTSGHEYEYMGGEHYLKSGVAPLPAATRLWCHIGASAAASDWHELGAQLLPLPSADSQRILTATPDIIDRVRPAFRGISGLEATYVASKAMAGGELVNVLDAGYRTAIGLYGGHRYFHTPADDMRCTSGELVQPVASAFAKAVANALHLAG